MAFHSGGVPRHLALTDYTCSTASGERQKRRLATPTARTFQSHQLAGRRVASSSAPSSVIRIPGLCRTLCCFNELTRQQVARSRRTWWRREVPSTSAPPNDGRRTTGRTGDRAAVLIDVTTSAMPAGLTLLPERRAFAESPTTILHRGTDCAWPRWEEKPAEVAVVLAAFYRRGRLTWRRSAQTRSNEHHQSIPAFLRSSTPTAAGASRGRAVRPLRRA